MKNARFSTDFDIIAELDGEEIMRIGRGKPTSDGMGLVYSLRAGIRIWDFSAYMTRGQ